MYDGGARKWKGDNDPTAQLYTDRQERIGDALDYDVHWQPNEYEPDGFVERVRPLELTNDILVASGCSQCGAAAHLLCRDYLRVRSVILLIEATYT
jgi:hypothetical protein